MIMDYKKNNGPEILIAPTVKPMHDIPKRPETVRKPMFQMSKDELIEYAAERLIGLMATFDEKLYRTDNAYKNEFDIQFMFGVSAYAMLGFKDIGFPVEEFLKKYSKSLTRVQVRKRILE
jgi:hypothetical protein